MNSLQNLTTDKNIFVTLNPLAPVARHSEIARFNYTHPMFSTSALDAQRRLWDLQGQKRTWFCGSYFGAGFHEDDLQSGLAVADSPSNVDSAIAPIPKPMSCNSARRVHSVDNSADTSITP